MALSSQCLVWSVRPSPRIRHGPGMEKQSCSHPQPSKGPWTGVIPVSLMPSHSRVTRWEGEGEGRVHASELDQGI